MPRNHSEKPPCVIKTRDVQTNVGPRTVYLSHVRKNAFRVSIREERGTTWRDYMSKRSALSKFDSIPDKPNWTSTFPDGEWCVEDEDTPTRGF
jgi:hypothetical protein